MLLTTLAGVALVAAYLLAYKLVSTKIGMRLAWIGVFCYFVVRPIVAAGSMLLLVGIAAGLFAWWEHRHDPMGEDYRREQQAALRKAKRRADEYNAKVIRT